MYGNLKSRSMSQETAIYITTMRADYCLAKALVSSIEANLPGPRIFIIPDDDYRGDSMFGYPVFRPTDPRVLALDGFYKKMRLFWGPAERFIHMDADQLVLRDLTAYVAYVAAHSRPFVLYNRHTGARDKIQSEGESAHRREFLDRIGEIDWLERFDPSIRWQSLPLINSGEFAASSDAIDQEDFLDTFARARRFYADNGLGAMNRSRRPGPFMGDQGFFSYYMGKRSAAVAVEILYNLYCWTGRIDQLVRFRPNDRTDPLTWVAVHWAGCLRPGPIPCPGRSPLAREWRRAHRRYTWTRGDVAGYAADAAADVVMLLRTAGSKVKRQLKRLLSVGRSRR